MTTHTNTQSKDTSASSFTPGRGLLLQRKCACGSSSSSVSGACPECQNKRLQPKLRIGASNDPLEQEADRVADQVMSSTSNPAINNAPPRIQRLTTHSGAENTIAPASVDRVLASNGSPLEPALQKDMSQRFGHDFSRVRVHADAAAEQSARDVNAHAYTVGHNVVFGAGQYAPQTHAGRRLLAHELTHVVQQGNGSSTKTIQRSWNWGRAGVGALIGGAGGALIGGLIGGPLGALVGAGIGALAGGLIGGLTGDTPAQAPACTGGVKTVAVDFVRLHGATRSPTTDLAAANTIFSGCCVNFVAGATPAQETLATTQSWLGGDTVLNVPEQVPCASPPAEESSMYTNATAAHGLSSRMRVFYPGSTTQQTAFAFSRPPYCAGGFPNHVVMNPNALHDTLAHEFGHILLNNAVHTGVVNPVDPRNLMFAPGRTASDLDATQCATIYANA